LSATCKNPRDTVNDVLFDTLPFSNLRKYRATVELLVEYPDETTPETLESVVETDWGDTISESVQLVLFDIQDQKKVLDSVN
jgi:hypothetical protein